MATNNFYISSDVNPANNQDTAAYQTDTFICSAYPSFVPTTGLSAVTITEIAAYGPGSTNVTISANRSLPVTLTKAAASAFNFAVIYDNASPNSDGTTFAQTLSVGISAGNAVLDAGATGTRTDGFITYTASFVLSSLGGWRGQSGGRIWSSHSEHKRMRNLGYI